VLRRIFLPKREETGQNGGRRKVYTKGDGLLGCSAV
jgi:hypothetical protein